MCGPKQEKVRKPWSCVCIVGFSACGCQKKSVVTFYSSCSKVGSCFSCFCWTWLKLPISSLHPSIIMVLLTTVRSLLNCISPTSARQRTSLDATKILIYLFVLSHLYFKENLIDKLQKIQKWRSPSVFSVFWKWRYFASSWGLTLVSSASVAVIRGTCSCQYLADLLHVYVPSRQLRSSSDDQIFRQP